MERLVVWGRRSRARRAPARNRAEITHQMDEQTKSLLARTNEVRHATTDALVSARPCSRASPKPERLTATVASLGQASTAAVEDLRKQTEALNGQLLDCRNRLASLTDGFNRVSTRVRSTPAGSLPKRSAAHRRRWSGRCGLRRHHAGRQQRGQSSRRTADQFHLSGRRSGPDPARSPPIRRATPPCAASPIRRTSTPDPRTGRDRGGKS